MSHIANTCLSRYLFTTLPYLPSTRRGKGDALLPYSAACLNRAAAWSDPIAHGLPFQIDESSSPPQPTAPYLGPGISYAVLPYRTNNRPTTRRGILRGDEMGHACSSRGHKDREDRLFSSVTKGGWEESCDVMNELGLVRKHVNPQSQIHLKEVSRCGSRDQGVVDPSAMSRYHPRQHPPHNASLPASGRPPLTLLILLISIYVCLMIDSFNIRLRQVRHSSYSVGHL